MLDVSRMKHLISWFIPSILTEWCKERGYFHRWFEIWIIASSSHLIRSAQLSNPVGALWVYRWCEAACWFLPQFAHTVHYWERSLMSGTKDCCCCYSWSSFDRKCLFHGCRLSSSRSGATPRTLDDPLQTHSVRRGWFCSTYDSRK